MNCSDNHCETQNALGMASGSSSSQKVEAMNYMYPYNPSICPTCGSCPTCGKKIMQQTIYPWIIGGSFC